MKRSEMIDRLVDFLNDLESMSQNKNADILLRKLEELGMKAPGHEQSPFLLEQNVWEPE